MGTICGFRGFFDCSLVRHLRSHNRSLSFGSEVFLEVPILFQECVLRCSRTVILPRVTERNAKIGACFPPHSVVFTWAAMSLRIVPGGGSMI